MRDLKRLKKKQRTRSAREKIVKVVSFIAWGIKCLAQQMKPILLNIFLKIAKTGLKKRTKT